MEDQVNLENQLAAAQGNNSFVTNLAVAVTHLQDMNNLAREVAQTFSQIVNAAIASISTNLTKVLEGTETWHKALLNIGMAIVNDLIGGIIQMGVRWVITQLMMEAFGNTLKAAALATSVAEAASLAGIWWTPAVLSTIASAGTTALDASAMVAAAVLGFKEGGYTGDRPAHEAVGVVHGREYVLSAPAVQRIGLANVEHFHRHGYADGGLVGGAAPAGGPNSGPFMPKVVVVSGRQELLEELKKPDYSHVIVQHVIDNKTRIGLPT